MKEMKNWENYDYGDIGVGVSVDGGTIVDTSIQAWNEEDFSDTENIVTIEGTVNSPEQIKISISYKYEFLKNDLKIKEMVQEQIEEVRKELTYIEDLQ